jgi:hypothetical protein
MRKRKKHRPIPLDASWVEFTIWTHVYDHMPRRQNDGRPTNWADVLVRAQALAKRLVAENPEWLAVEVERYRYVSRICDFDEAIGPKVREYAKGEFGELLERELGPYG